MNKIIYCFILFLLLGLANGKIAVAQDRVRVVTTLFPLYDMVRIVGGDRVEPELLLPPGVEPHAFEPTTGDIARINDAALFIYTGAVMEPWAEKLLPAITNQNLAIIDASQSLAPLWGEEEHHHDQGEEIAHHSGVDPHIWLDLSYDVKIIDKIVDALSEVDADQKELFRNNGEEYKKRLLDLDRRYAEGLKNCQHRTIIYGGHFAFGYLAKRYALDHVSPYAGFSPDAEPSPRAVAGLIQTMRASGQDTIYYEELLDPKVSRIIAEETGAKLVLLHAAHNLSLDERTAGVTFLSIMEENLKKLQTGLQCQ